MSGKAGYDCSPLGFSYFFESALHRNAEFYPALDEYLLKDVIIPLAHRETVLAREGLHVFAVQGNLVQQSNKGYRPQVWEIFQP